jgi:uncharacterized protein YqiB (DUF1249 family)
VGADQFSVDLSGHHSVCELNFHRLLKLMPGFDAGHRSWVISTSDPSSLQIDIRVVDVAPYTTTVDVLQTQGKVSFMSPAQIRVRLYHDVAMAEVVGWNRHRHWLPQYDYPNKHMYHPDEKLSLNRFLGDWLSFCRKQGLARVGNCDQVLDNGK